MGLPFRSALIVSCTVDLATLNFFASSHTDIPTSLAPQMGPLVPGDYSLRSVFFLEGMVLRSGWFRWGVILCGVALHAKCPDTNRHRL